MVERLNYFSCNAQKFSILITGQVKAGNRHKFSFALKIYRVIKMPFSFSNSFRTTRMKCGFEVLLQQKRICYYSHNLYFYIRGDL